MRRPKLPAAASLRKPNVRGVRRGALVALDEFNFRILLSSRAVQEAEMGKLSAKAHKNFLLFSVDHIFMRQAKRLASLKKQKLLSEEEYQKRLAALQDALLGAHKSVKKSSGKKAEGALEDFAWHIRRSPEFRQYYGLSAQELEKLETAPVLNATIPKQTMGRTVPSEGSKLSRFPRGPFAVRNAQTIKLASEKALEISQQIEAIKAGIKNVSDGLLAQGRILDLEASRRKYTAFIYNKLSEEEAAKLE